MKIVVTGATGFIGNYVIAELLAKKAEVIAIGRNIEKAKQQPWFNKVTFLEYDINRMEEGQYSTMAAAGKMIHLAWEGLPNYKEIFHLEENLFSQYQFLKRSIEAGVTDITVTGTCFEYGMKEGPLSTNLPTDPQIPYAIAKDTLRKFLQQLQTKKEFKLKWMRLFYMYGKGQSEKSILSQLEKAIANGDEHFNMSGGEQLRDYLPVEMVANCIVDAALDNEKNGIYNCCSGKPISIKTLVENYMENHSKKIKLNLSYYPYPDYEPMAFWGVI